MIEFFLVAAASCMAVVLLGIFSSSQATAVQAQRDELSLEDEERVRRNALREVDSLVERVKGAQKRAIQSLRTKEAGIKRLQEEARDNRRAYAALGVKSSQLGPGSESDVLRRNLESRQRNLNNHHELLQRGINAEQRVLMRIMNAVKLRGVYIETLQELQQRAPGMSADQILGELGQAKPKTLSKAQAAGIATAYT